MFKGSTWHRWDPHIHAPGTVLNDQFGGAGSWNDYLKKIEQSEPRIRALGITDYAGLELYQQVQGWKTKGRLSEVDLIFPNVELRLSTGTGKDTAINLHLLISPEDSDHIERARGFLRGLQFERKGEQYRCDRADLVRLGRAHDPSKTDESAALKTGVTQFKANFVQLRELFRGSGWAQRNILVAFAAGSNDGTSGVSNDAGFASLRKEIEGFSDIVFSADPKQRDFWLGRGAATPEQLRVEWQGLKPCLHGSDAHSLGAVGAPAKDRFCWIKGVLTFESLRQACIEPDQRTFIGTKPPEGALPSQIIQSVTIQGADWADPKPMQLNPGLVAIIGARGSGKTAIADLIAAGASAAQWDNRHSFVHRARELLGPSKVILHWADKTSLNVALKPPTPQQIAGREVRVQYLSQQFVERLCSAEGATDELLLEIERVIFQALPGETKLGATSFQELRELRLKRPRTRRERAYSELSEVSEKINVEIDKRESVAGLKKVREALTRQLAADQKDKEILVKAAPTAHTERLEVVSAALDRAQEQLDAMNLREEALLALKDEVADFKRAATAQLSGWKEKYSTAGLSAIQWKQFLPTFAGDAGQVVKDELNKADQQIKKLRGATIAPIPKEKLAASKPVFADDAELAAQTVNALSAEVERLRGLAGIGVEHQKKLSAVSMKISTATTQISKLDRQIADAEKAADRIKELIEERLQSYRAVFSAVIAQEGELAKLYAPLQDRLTGQSGSLGKLTFSVRRRVDVDKWAEAGEALLDLRKNGPFRLHGTLAAAAKAALEMPWRVGTADDIAVAMRTFITTHEDALRQHAPEDALSSDGRKAWARRISEWLYGIDHVSVDYSLQFDGIEIEQQSPGTRGIVLLLLYLALDQEDDRPLIVDQPEENLDPRSVYLELVEHFRQVKLRRQIIIVTHNANLVVNTDADQVIVAAVGPHTAGRLPRMTYVAGGLESPTIRQAVCEILEGGEAAFQERARRLRLKI